MYREDHHRKALTKEQNIYNRMLEFNKGQYIINKVNESTNTSRQLFKVVGNLLGKKDVHPMPPSTSNSQLGEEFAEFFHTKIERIKKKFKDIEPYQPIQLGVPQLRKFVLPG